MTTAVKLPTVTAPNATIVDDTHAGILTRTIGRLIAKGAKIENVSTDGWERGSRDSRYRGAEYRIWAIDCTIETAEGTIWGCVQINETRGWFEFGLYAPSNETDPAYGHSKLFRAAIGWRD